MIKRISVTEKMKKVLRVSYAISTLLLVVTVVLAIPHVEDIPDYVSAKQVLLDGKSYILIEGGYNTGISSLTVVRIYTRGNVVYIDNVESIYPPFTPGPIGVYLPRIIPFKDLSKGNYDIRVRQNGRYQKVFSFSVP